MPADQLSGISGEMILIMEPGVASVGATAPSPSADTTSKVELVSVDPRLPSGRWIAVASIKPDVNHVDLQIRSNDTDQSIALDLVAYRPPGLPNDVRPAPASLLYYAWAPPELQPGK
jgi:hypothetical protein